MKQIFTLTVVLLALFLNAQTNVASYTFDPGKVNKRTIVENRFSLSGRPEIQVGTGQIEKGKGFPKRLDSLSVLIK